MTSSTPPGHDEKLSLDLYIHSIQYATKIMKTRRRLKIDMEKSTWLFSNPPDPPTTFLLI